MSEVSITNLLLGATIQLDILTRARRAREADGKPAEEHPGQTVHDLDWIMRQLWIARERCARAAGITSTGSDWKAGDVVHVDFRRP